MTRGYDHRPENTWNEAPLPDPKPRYDGLEGLGDGIEGFGPQRTAHDVETFRTPPVEEDDQGRIANHLVEQPAPAFERPNHKKRNILLTIGGAGVAIALGIGTLLGRSVSADKDNAAPVGDVPVATATANPGSSETAPSTSETSIDNLKVHVDGKEINAQDFLKEYGVYRVNNPKVTTTPEVKKETWADYLGAVKTATHIKTDPGAEEGAKEVTDQLLFVKGASGALPEFIDMVRTKHGEITGFEDIESLNVPIHYAAGGSAIIVVQYPKETIRYAMNGTLVNDSGIIHSPDNGAMIGELPPK